MAVQWPEGWDEEDLRRATRAQAFQVRDGVVVDIRDVDEHRIADSMW